MKNSDRMLYLNHENYPVEVLRLKTAPEHMQAYLEVDHEVWSVMECNAPGFDESPFLYKETWINDNHPGEIVVVIVWKSQEAWDKVGEIEFQKKLTQEFDSRFPFPYEFLGGLADSEVLGIRRVCRFEENLTTPHS